jgi:hypothetical protein
VKIIAQCEIPDELMNEWLQHLRNFDVEHSGCQFEVLIQTSDMIPVHELVESLKLHPELSIEEIFDLKRKE